MADSQPPQTSSFVKFGILAVLLLALSFVLVHFNLVSCGFYSSLGCDIYYSVVSGGKPRVLIVSGSEGIGNPQFLHDVLNSPRFNARARIIELELVSLPKLQENQLVIVERARRMSVEELEMFRNYVNRGGRLVWIGDAGTTAPENQSDSNFFLMSSERKKGGAKEFISPWARKAGEKTLSFDYLLGVNYRGNYCELSGCADGEIVGYMNIVQQDKRLVYGLSQNLPLYGDFSIVTQSDGAYQTTLAFLDYQTQLVFTPPEKYFWLKKERQSLGKEFPLVVVSGVGDRVAYYAVPPEYFVGEKMPLDKKTGQRIAYWGIIENMYYGMLYK